jgi:hypothetical protein
MPLEIAPITLTDEAVTAPDVTLLTTKSIDGTGVFDVLMKATKLHLTEEFTAGRITGKEYSEVYLGALNSVLAQSVQFLAVKDQTEKLTAEIGLIRQQTVTELAQTGDLIPVGLGFNDGTDISGLTANELVLSAAKIVMTEKQAEQIDQSILQSVQEIILIEQKQVTELAQTSDIKPLTAGLISSIDITGTAGAAIAKIVAEEKLTNQKTVSEVANVADILPTTLGTSTNSAPAGTVKLSQDLLTEQVVKTVSEQVLLNQKSVSELAQTSDTVPLGTGLNTSTPVTGVVDKQKTLYGRQADGFLRDAEQKAAKMMLETWIVRMTSDDGALASTAGIADADIAAILVKLKAGVV